MQPYVGRGKLLLSALEHDHPPCSSAALPIELTKRLAVRNERFNASLNYALVRQSKIYRKYKSVLPLPPPPKKKTLNVHASNKFRTTKTLCAQIAVGKKLFQG